MRPTLSSAAFVAVSLALATPIAVAPFTLLIYETEADPGRRAGDGPEGGYGAFAAAADCEAAPGWAARLPAAESGAVEARTGHSISAM